MDLYIFKILNPFHATGLFLYSLKTWQNQRFNDVSREYKKRPVVQNGLGFIVQTELSLYPWGLFFKINRHVTANNVADNVANYSNHVCCAKSKITGKN